MSDPATPAQKSVREAIRTHYAALTASERKFAQALLDKYAPGNDPTVNTMFRLKQVCGQLLGKRSESSEHLPSPYSRPIIQSSSCIPGTNKDNLRRAQGKRAKGRSSR